MFSPVFGQPGSERSGMEFWLLFQNGDEITYPVPLPFLGDPPHYHPTYTARWKVFYQLVVCVDSLLSLSAYSDRVFDHHFSLSQIFLLLIEERYLLRGKIYEISIPIFPFITAWNPRYPPDFGVCEWEFRNLGSAKSGQTYIATWEYRNFCLTKLRGSFGKTVLIN